MDKRLKKILIIDHEPFRSFKISRYCIDRFIGEGYEVEFWSVYKALSYSKKSSYSTIEHHSAVTNIESYELLMEKIKSVDSDTIVFLEIFYNWDTWQLFWVLKRKKVKLFKIDYFLNTSSFFTISGKAKLVYRIKNFVFVPFCKTILRSLASRTLDIVFRLNNYNLMFLTGGQICHFYPQQKKVSINYFDVETFSQLKPKVSHQSKYVVFLDINLVSHPDLSRYGSETLNQETYIAKLKPFFEEITRRTGYDVTIAAHPSSNYFKEFGEIKVITGNTAELVSRSEFVLLHNSAALNFALLAKKPMIFIYFDQFIDSHNYLDVIFASMKQVSAYFGAPLINLDRDNFDFLGNLTINALQYERYLKDIIYSDLYPKSNWEIIRDHITELRAD